MSLKIKDGDGNSRDLKADQVSGEYVVYHAISGTVSTSITGVPSVAISNSPSVTITGTPTVALSSNIVTSSIANIVTASLSGIPTVSIQNTSSLTASIYGVATITGSVGITSINNPVYVTSSEASPVYVSSSVDRPVVVTGTVAVGTVTVTSSLTNPVYVSSSYSTPVVTKEKLPNTLTLGFFNAGVGQGIDWASTASVNVSGTFIIAQSSSTRSGLMFTNNFQNNIYVIYDSGYYSNNGFGSLTSTASAPSFFSFILYPNGTYTADPAFVNVKHSGFIVSASNISSNTQLSVYSTE
jgi:hypothetical protein